jgi:hypothetical protein
MNHLIPNSAVPERPLQNLKSMVCIPAGITILSTAPEDGKAKGGEKIK